MSIPALFQFVIDLKSAFAWLSIQLLRLHSSIIVVDPLRFIFFGSFPKDEMCLSEGPLLVGFALLGVFGCEPEDEACFFMISNVIIMEPKI